MSQSRALALQLCPLSAYLESGLSERCTVVRWFELDEAARTAWLAQHAAQVRAVITNGHVGCSNALMDALPALSVIAVNGVGVDKLDLAHAQARNILVGTTPGTLHEDVADLAVGLIISLLRGIPASDAHVRAGSWPSAERPLARKVTGRRFGIVGLGSIGGAIASRLAVFGPVAYTGPTRKAVDWDYVADLQVLARASDVLVVACPATAATRHLIDATVLDALGPDGYLINISRGAVVDEQALIAALAAHQLAGAGLDVFENEPQVPPALRSSERVVLTPHIASATVETRKAMADLVLGHLDDGLSRKV